MELIWTELVAVEDDEDNEDDLERECSGNERHIPMNRTAKTKKVETPRIRSPMAATTRRERIMRGGFRQIERARRVL